MFVLEKNPTSKLDKSGKVLIHCSIVVHVPWHTSETMWSSVSRQESLIYKYIFCENLVKKACRKLVAMSCCLLEKT